MQIIKKMEPWVFGGAAPPWRETKLEEEKRKHDLELKQLKEEVRSGNRIREIREQTIERTDKYLDCLGTRMTSHRHIKVHNRSLSDLWVGAGGLNKC